MQILKTTLIEFDETAERTRIETAFEGEIREALLSIWHAFVALRWDECHELLRALTREELEYVHETVFDVIKERAGRNLRIAQAAAQGANDPLRRGARYFPKFDVEGVVD